MNTIHCTEVYRGAKITYIPMANGLIDAFVNDEAEPLIMSQDMQWLRERTHARIEREAVI